MNTTNIRNILVVAAAITTVSCEDHFDLGKIDDSQLADYARRRGVPVNVMRRFLVGCLQ